MLGDRQGRGFRITQLRAVASSPTISTIRDISLVLGGVALRTEKDDRAKYQPNQLCVDKIPGQEFHSLPFFPLNTARYIFRRVAHPS